MSSLLFPILPLQLDPRNTISLAKEIQNVIYDSSNGQLNDFSPASPLSALTEGQAFAQGELLYYMNNLPEAWTLQWLRLVGIQRILGSTASVEVTFFRTVGFPGTIVIPSGTNVSTSSGLVFLTSSDLVINDGESLGSVLAYSTNVGSIYNIAPGQINTLITPFVGITSVTNFNSGFGGNDLESIDQLKNRAFEFIKKRGLITKSDFENYVASLIGFRGPVVCLDQDISNSLGFPSSSINILVSEANGKPIPINEKSIINSELDSKSPVGSSISIIDPVVNPVSIRVEVSYSSTDGGRAIAQSVYNTLSSTITPSSTGFGANLDYTILANLIRNTPNVNNLIYLDINIYSGNYSFNTQKGQNDFIALNLISNLSSEGTYVNDNPISTYRLYSLDVYVVPGENFASGITYSYGILYDL